ncbi:MAG: AraC family ligand binding domain-containing protein, partial [Clostridia bacterium]|nr:AraC family ligand binding domain-containing protein [Clostridia bacterium]
MGRKKRDRLEFRFYEVPKGESVLALLGQAWVGTYGHQDERRHFHNLLEVGYCHYGSGHLLLGDRTVPYEDAMISAIPAYYPHSTVSSEVSSWEYLFFDVEELLAEMVPDNSKRLAENLFTVNKRASLLRIEEYPELSATVWRILEEARERRPYRKELIRSLLKI